MTSAPGDAAPGGEDLTFAYHRAIAPMMWVFVGLASVEVVVVHGLLAVWLPWLALILSIVTVAGIGWLVLAIGSMKHRPVLIDDERVLMRVGRIKAISVPLANIAAVRREIARAEIDRRTLDLGLIAHPNVVLVLRHPQPVGRREVHAVAHRLDDPAAFVAALEQRRASV